MTGARRLRELLAGEQLIVAPGIYDGISAALVAASGFPAAYMTGAGVSASGFGLPDVGLVTLTEMAERARVLSGVLGAGEGPALPLIADADTGYGSPVNVVRTVQEYERAGVAAIQLEDQTLPKRCGHLAGKDVIAAARFAVAIEAAVQARRDPDTVIVARTDARAPLGLDEAIARGRTYAEHGADVIFIEAPQSEAEIERIAKEIDAPLLLNIVPGGRTPELPAARLAELGYRIVIHPGALLFEVSRAAIAALEELAGRSGARPEAGAGVEAFFDLFGLARWSALAERYAAYEEPSP
ncbi:MAG TPA: isocitrate lyase/PEP mutase family protein [Solirubrobacteraceae bacterium]|jgi:2-methylisocitrate lyase-like PEP mutase family enzyme|nr:isocitrate lyase/PEP mutase family protein [Solirubrobacteraceae bacterium]